MRLIASSLLVAVAVLAAAGCTKDNPNFCEGVGCDAREIDAVQNCSATDPCDVTSTTPFCVENQCVGCGTPADCDTLEDDRDLCLKIPTTATYGECVVCDEANRQAPDVGTATDECQTANLQVCDGESHTCRACGPDSECTSGFCSAGGCIAADQIAYVVATGGTNNPTCSTTQKCATLHQGLATNKLFILVAPGTYTDNAGPNDVDINNQNVTIRATGATFSRSTPGKLINIRGNSMVTIEGGTFDGAGDDEEVFTTTNNTTVTLERVTVMNASGGNTGILAAGDLVVRHSTISANSSAGIDVTDSGNDFELTSSTIIRNGLYGVRVAARTATIVNNFIVKNGAGGSVSALRLDSIGMIGASRIEFNTIAGNLADVSTSGVGVSCGAATIVVSNSIIFSNNGANEQAGCLVRYSTVEDGIVDVVFHNTNVAPSFVATGNDNFHLMPGSPVAGLADPAAATGAAATDFDGELRPTPPTPADLGADEIP